MFPIFYFEKDLPKKENILKTRELFVKHYNEEPTDFFKSCGRLEIIGNHVDYNGGSVINSSAAGVFIEALKQDKITAVYGAAHGIRGVLEENFYDISKEDMEELLLLKN